MNAETHIEDAEATPAPPPLPNVRQFREKLGAFLRTWRFGLFLTSLFRILTVLFIAIAIYGVIDYFLALGPGTRSWISGTLAALALFAILWEAIRIAQLGDTEIAKRADRLSANRRRPVLSALELLGGSRSSSSTKLESYLVKRSIDEANTSLSGLDRSQVFPRDLFRSQLVRFLGFGAGIVVLAIVFSQVTSVLLSRITSPWKDIPPYSPLTFTVTPTQPEIFYGDDATISVELSGAPLSQPVRFLTRDGDEVFEMVCFQDGPNQFAQKLERVVRPTEFAFAHGKARSEWYSIDLLMEPKIALASITVTPPPYTGQPQRSFLVGEKPLAVLRGSQISLSLTSNRPLLDGELTRNPTAGTTTAGRSAQGSKTGMQTVLFEWTAEEESEIEAIIRDVRGTPNRDPFRIAQRIIPDQPPKLTLEKPSLQMMATPSIEVPMKIEASDDLGINRVEMIRTVVGYRDRGENISPPNPTKTFDFESKIPLPELGVAPGETLEVYFQAMDKNPSLLGVASSEVARIQIISDEEYAHIIRTRTTIEEFSERFRLVNRSLNELTEALTELEEAEKAGDSEEAKEKREAATEAAKDASELFRRLSEDFAAFELEENAIENAKESLEKLEAIEKQLQGGSPLSPQQIAEMRESLTGAQQDSAEQQKQAEEVAAVSEVMRKSVEFSAIVRDQDTLTRRLKKFEQEARSSDLPFLEALGQDQKAMEERVEELIESLEESIAELPSGYEQLKAGAESFLSALKQSGAQQDMDTSADAADKENGPESYQFSSLALEKLKALQNGDGQSGEGFCQLSEGDLKFPVPGELEPTLSQMLSAMCFGQGNQPGNQPGSNPGRGGSGGGGLGMGGNSEDGYSMAGYSALDIPVLGPPRMRLEDLPQSRLAGDDRNNDPGKGPTNTSVNEADRVAVEEKSAPAGTPLDFGNVPEKYRDAVKRYFTPSESSTPTNESP